MPLFRRLVSVTEAAAVIREALAADAKAPLPTDLQELLFSLHRREPLQPVPEPPDPSSAQLVEAFPDPAGIVEEGCRFVCSNAALDELFAGRTRGRTVLHATRSAELNEAVQAALEGRAGRREVTIPALEKTVMAIASPLPGGRALLVMRDLTGQKRAESVRRDFISNASHELRTPVAAIAGAAETLLGMDLGEGQRTFAELIARQASRLARLTNDLLDLSRLESGTWPVEIGPYELLPIAEAALALGRARAQAKGIQLVSDVPPALRVRADLRALEQILVNLLDNAIKYTPASGRVTLLADGAGSEVIISVLDTGPGIEPRHQARIFERFYRVDGGRARSEGGSGLGLAIVKHLAQAQGAEVGVESGRGGSRFWVRLPAG